jgi:hypothetical protein
MKQMYTEIVAQELGCSSWSLTVQSCSRTETDQLCYCAIAAERVIKHRDAEVLANITKVML